MEEAGEEKRRKRGSSRLACLSPWELDYKVERRRIDAFELWCWRRLLRVPWTARRSKQSILKAISLGCSLEGLMLKLKLQSFGHLMQRADSLEKTPMLGENQGRRRRDNGEWDGWMASSTRWTRVWVDPGSWWWTGRPGVLQFMRSQTVDMIERLNWTELKPEKGGKVAQYFCNQQSLFQDTGLNIENCS